MNKSNAIYSVVESGQDGLKIEVECQLSNGIPNVVIVGYANKAVDEAKERLRSAFAASETPLPRKRIIINLAPADIPKEGTSFDLAIAAAIIVASGKQNMSLPEQAIIGELGLDGTVRPVRGIVGKLLAGKRQGITHFMVPEKNMPQALLIPDVQVTPISNLLELQKILAGIHKPETVDTSSYGHHEAPETVKSAPKHDIVDIIGQEMGKRAIEICAAGGHNLLLGGPPGTGKSMLAATLPGILPRMSQQETLEVTHLHSLASNNFSKIVHERPFRSPHHSASHVAITGGGNNVRPGEMSLSHHGVLLFDEFPEFTRQTIESLRQPLESRTVSIARAKESAEYPAHFIFVATANPCPCGHYGTKKECRCLPHQINQYRRKLSGPILDRIDIYVDVHEIDNSKLLETSITPEDTSATLAKRVKDARELQAKRYGDDKILNADLTNHQIKTLAKLSEPAKQLLNAGAEKFELSPRAYMRTVKVARTIADLDSSEEIKTQHVAEALQYRPQHYHVD